MSGDIVKKEPEVIDRLTLVSPPISTEEVLDHFKKIQDLKQRLVDLKTDVIKIAEKPYILKSGWRKLAFAFNLSDEIIREEKESKDGETIYRIWVRVTAPNGRSVVAVGCASSVERKFTHEAHDPYALAHTRAKNRAISDILGLGEVSAEEMFGTDEKPIVDVTITTSVPASAPASVPTSQTTIPKTSPTTVTVSDRPTKILDAPPGSEFLTSKNRPYGYIKRTEHGAELYFVPPLDMDNIEVQHLVENFLYARVLEGIRDKVSDDNVKNGTDYIFDYTPIIESGKLLGISISADREALTDERFGEIKRSSAWTAARAQEKVQTK
ncbi:MAG: hypothetical protein QXT77_05930 [Candidatus Methanomethylicaceae archaeon]